MRIQIALCALLVAVAAAPAPAARPPRTPAAPDYDLDVRVAPDERRLDVSGTVRLPATASRRDTLCLVLSNQMRELRVEVLEPRASVGPTELSAVREEHSTRWTIRPARPVPSGGSVLLRFSYTGGDQLDRIFYVGPEVVFASAYGTDWYPLICDPSDKGTGRLQLSVPAGLVAHSEGARVSTPAEEARGIFRFENRHLTYFSFAAGAFRAVRGGARIPVVLYLLKEREGARAFADGVSRMVESIAEEFGPYPFRELTVVEIPRDLALKASFNAAAARGTVYANHRVFDVPDVSMIYEFLGHEIAHSWFPHTVALTTPPGLYMEEALAEYAGMRVVEKLAGPAAAAELRRTGYAPDPIFSARHYFELVGRGVDHPLGRLERSPDHRQIAYTKGALVWHMLAREVGHERFGRALAGIVRAYAFRGIRWQRFLDEIAARSGRRLDWFYEQWFERTGAPEFRLSWRQEGGAVRGAVTQTAPHYRATLEVVVEEEGGRRRTVRVRADGAETPFSVPARARVRSVTLDPDFHVLMRTGQSANHANPLTLIREDSRDSRT
jgi:aminopeptidase N